jgi:hypothetical protein
LWWRLACLRRGGASWSAAAATRCVAGAGRGCSAAAASWAAQ